MEVDIHQRFIQHLKWSRVCMRVRGDNSHALKGVSASSYLLFRCNSASELHVTTSVNTVVFLLFWNGKLSHYPHGSTLMCPLGSWNKILSATDVFKKVFEVRVHYLDFFFFLIILGFFCFFMLGWTWCVKGFEKHLDCYHVHCHCWIKTMHQLYFKNEVCKPLWACPDCKSLW